MKTAMVLFFVFLISLQSFAQENPEILSSQAKVKKYRNMRNTGIVLTALGGVLCIVGINKMTRSIDLWSSSQNDTYKSGETSSIIGVVCLAGGIPLLTIGAHHERKYKRELKNLSVKLNVNPQNKGLTLTYRF